MRPGTINFHVVMTAVVLAILALATCSKNSTGSDVDDGSSPFAIIDLAVDTVTGTSVKLIWTATGDDSDEGTATSYDIRYWKNCPNGENWDSATLVTGEPHPSPAGQLDSMTITGLMEDSAYQFAMRIIDEAGNFGGSICAMAICIDDHVVHFADSHLDAAVRELIGKPTGDILLSDLRAHTTFDGGYKSIDSLNGMEEWWYLANLNLAGNGLTDLTPLSTLTNLVGLGLTDNHLVDLSPVAGLVNLEVLHIRTNSVTDLTHLTGLTKLRALDMTQNSVDDLLPLVNNPGLAADDTIYVGENPLSSDAINVQIPALQARGVTVLGL